MAFLRLVKDYRHHKLANHVAVLRIHQRRREPKSRAACKRSCRITHDHALAPITFDRVLQLTHEGCHVRLYDENDIAVEWHCESPPVCALPLRP